MRYVQSQNTIKTPEGRPQSGHSPFLLGGLAIYRMGFGKCEDLRTFQVIRKDGGGFEIRDNLSERWWQIICQVTPRKYYVFRLMV